jgi:hypothetical protein
VIAPRPPKVPSGPITSASLGKCSMSLSKSRAHSSARDAVIRLSAPHEIARTLPLTRSGPSMSDKLSLVMARSYRKIGRRYLRRSRENIEWCCASRARQSRPARYPRQCRGTKFSSTSRVPGPGSRGTFTRDTIKIDKSHGNSGSMRHSSLPNCFTTCLVHGLSRPPPIPSNRHGPQHCSSKREPSVGVKHR